VYQLLNYVINERLKKIVEPANILEPGQGGGQGGGRAREFIRSTLTLKTPSTPCLKLRYGS